MLAGWQVGEIGRGCLGEVAEVSPYFLSFPSCTSALPVHYQLGDPSLAMCGRKNRRLGCAHQGPLVRRRGNRHGVELGAPQPPTVPCSSLL